MNTLFAQKSNLIVQRAFIEMTIVDTYSPQSIIFHMLSFRTDISHNVILLQMYSFLIILKLRINLIFFGFTKSIQRNTNRYHTMYEIKIIVHITCRRRQLSRQHLKALIGVQNNLCSLETRIFEIRCTKRIEIHDL